MTNKCELGDAVNSALDEYFLALNGHPPHAIYDMVLLCIEKPLLEYILRKAGGNQSKAAEILGLNRNTLRKKLKQHQIE
jgi:Fis family transcriptional regulator, factor for inversion stimulation protein